jgi:DNA-binding NarL/FixJ family response regulator
MRAKAAEVPRSFAIVGAGLSKAAKKQVLHAIPQCHILASKMDSWRVVRFCKLVGATILIVEYESLAQLESEQVPAVEYLSTVEVLVLCPNYADEVFEKAVSAGCSGVVAVDAPPEELQAAVKAVCHGDLWYPRAFLSALVRRSILNRSIWQKGLTTREAEILRLLGTDKRNQEIADELFISRETVRWHLRTLYSKIGVKNRAEAQIYAQKHREDQGP